MALRGNKNGAGYKTAETIKRLEGLRKDATKTIAFRMDPRDVDRLQKIADQRGLKLAQLVKSWVIERLNS